MIKILANDGLGSSGLKILQEHGFEVITNKVEQEDLIDFINKNKISALLVRSATSVPRELINSCPTIKLIGRVGAGMDHIDVEYALEKGIKVLSTPVESAPSVAELVFAHLFSISRRLFDANRNLPKGISFRELKKKYKDGIEINGKTLGIIGFGRIGQEVAKRALGLGMKVIASDPFVADANIKITIPDHNDIYVNIQTLSQEHVLKNSDFITLHLPLPHDKKPIITKKEIEQMKDGVIIINVSKGGVIDENDLLEALDSGKVAFAGIDVFCNEPLPNPRILQHEKISVTPHVGGATVEAQERISITLSKEIINFFKNK
ncbi:MAG: D-2-hydroxyacid dehydrogenase [Marinilabiliales bacterium]